MSYTQIDNSYRPLDCISFSSDPLITIQTTKLYPFLFVVQLQSYSHPDYYIGIRNGYEAYIVKLSQPKDFHVVSPGLCGLPGTISFQSVSIPSNYLRQRFFVINEDPFCNSTLYKRDACFYQRRDEWFLGHLRVLLNRVTSFITSHTVSNLLFLNLLHLLLWLLAFGFW